MRISDWSSDVCSSDLLDRVAAETLVGARPAAVINASSSMTGRYPNIGPLALTEAGIPLIDAAGTDVMAIEEGSRVTIRHGTVFVGDDQVAVGERQTHAEIGRAHV